MGKISFQKIGGSGAAPVIDVPQAADQSPEGSERQSPQTGLIVAPQTQVARAPFSDDDNIPFNDVILPRLNIVQKVGDLSNIYPHGSVLLNQELIVLEAPPAKKTQEKGLRLVVIGFKQTQYVEKVEGGIGGNIVKSTQEVVDAGGTVDWNEAKNTGKPLYQPMATALVAVERPECACEDATSFPYSVDGKEYALALWSMKGSAYTGGAKVFFTARKQGHLRNVALSTRRIQPERGGYVTAFWEVRTTLRQFGSNYAFVPVIKPAQIRVNDAGETVTEGGKIVLDETSLKFREFADGVLGQ